MTLGKTRDFDVAFANLSDKTTFLENSQRTLDAYKRYVYNIRIALRKRMRFMNVFRRHFDKKE